MTYSLKSLFSIAFSSLNSINSNKINSVVLDNEDSRFTITSNETATQASAQVYEISNTLNWLDQYNYALSIGGRLPVRQEIVDNESGLKKQGQDRWVAGIKDINGGTESSNRDWYQIGNYRIHKYGKSHVSDQGGYPSWGDGKGTHSFRVHTVVVGSKKPVDKGPTGDGERHYGSWQNYVFENHSYRKT